MADEINDQSEVIEARAAPLSHLDTSESQKWSWRLDWRSNALIVLVAAFLVFALVWQPDVTPTAVPSGAAVKGVERQPQSQADEETLPPFAQLNEARARELAQEKLARFVEQQILLEGSMQVGIWGEEALAAAKALAIEGDAEFVAERYESSVASYEAAADALAQLIEAGNARFAEHLASGNAAIDQLDAKAAVAELTSALTIKPEDEAAKRALARAEQLPEVIGLLRTAKNHELGERFNEAVAVYDEIASLDPAVVGLSELRAAALAGAQGNNLNGYLSQGFAALERNEFERARAAFNQALKLDPGNDVAAGGLQQVEKQNDLDVIAAARARAEEAMAVEAWQRAIDAYQEILDLDSNIQFALAGRRVASAHERAERLLTRIKDEPQKLSSEKLYLDAQVIVREARELSRRGPKLDELVDEVDELLLMYRDPVEVVLLSDNATNIIMSNVGMLGRFERKTLSLRPGQYTIRGSADGCRDIYLSVDVLPGIAPINLSCAEALRR